MSAPDLQPVQPIICRIANRLLLAVEQSLRNFHRCLTYQAGADLRQQAMHMAPWAQRAWCNRAQQVKHWVQHWVPHVRQLVSGIDAFKLAQQMAKTIQAIQAFVSFAQFEACATLAAQTDSRSASHTLYTAPAAHEVKA
jgi:hypothetical protein